MISSSITKLINQAKLNIANATPKQQTIATGPVQSAPPTTKAVSSSANNSIDGIVSTENRRASDSSNPNTTNTGASPTNANNQMNTSNNNSDTSWLDENNKPKNSQPRAPVTPPKTSPSTTAVSSDPVATTTDTNLYTSVTLPSKSGKQANLI